MRRVQDTAPQRFEALFRAHHRPVLRYAQRRTDRDTAEEIAAETFAIAWRRLEDVPVTRALPWLLLTAGNLLSNHRRSSARQAEKTYRAANEPMPATSDPAERHAEREVVVQAFAGLSESDREALRLIAWDGLSASEAARVLDVSRLAFSKRFSRARRRLREALAELERDGNPLSSIAPAASRPQQNVGSPVAAIPAAAIAPSVTQPERPSDA